MSHIRAFCIGMIALIPQGASGADLIFEVAGLRSSDGLIRVAVCPPETFTKPTCPHVATAPAIKGEVAVPGVPDGIYAVQAFHDEDSDGTLDRRGFRPQEGLAFSNDAAMRFGPPRFRDAAIQVRGNGHMTLNMRYYQ